MPKICPKHYFLKTWSLKQSQNVRPEEKIKADAFVIILERTTVKKKKKIMLKNEIMGYVDITILSIP